MKKQKFELRIAVDSDDKKVGVKVEVWKDGKSSDFRLLRGDNRRLAYESLMYATGIVARLYLEQLHEDGKITDEQYQKLRMK